jgi:hypothetical protein
VSSHAHGPPQEFNYEAGGHTGKKKRLPKTWDSTPLKLCPEASSVTAEEREAAAAAAATVRVRHHALGMVGYVLSRTGAERLLKLTLPLKDKAIDQVLTDIVRKQRLGTDGVFVSHPPLVHHDYLLGSQRRVSPPLSNLSACLSRVFLCTASTPLSVMHDSGVHILSAAYRIKIRRRASRLRLAATTQWSSWLSPKSLGSLTTGAS